jgi:hypothetical protein
MRIQRRICSLFLLLSPARRQADGRIHKLWVAGWYTGVKHISIHVFGWFELAISTYLRSWTVSASNMHTIPIGQCLLVTDTIRFKILHNDRRISESKVQVASPQMPFIILIFITCQCSFLVVLDFYWRACLDITFSSRSIFFQRLELLI